MKNESSLLLEILNRLDHLESNSIKKWEPAIEAYISGYVNRYGSDPKIGPLEIAYCRALVSSVGLNDAISIIANYLQQRGTEYEQAYHPISLCLRDYKLLQTPKKQEPKKK